MRVKMLRSLGNHSNGKARDESEERLEGREYDLPDKEADELIKAGLACRPEDAPKEIPAPPVPQQPGGQQVQPAAPVQPQPAPAPADPETFKNDPRATTKERK